MTKFLGAAAAIALVAGGGLSTFHYSADAGVRCVKQQIPGRIRICRREVRKCDWYDGKMHCTYRHVCHYEVRTVTVMRCTRDVGPIRRTRLR